MSQPKTAGHVHPLMRFVPAERSIEEWFEEWHESRYTDDRLGLLHSLTTEDGCWHNNAKLVMLLLEVADGHTNGYQFLNPNDGNPEKIARSRQTIAKKAFSVLCPRFFKEGREGGIPHWWWMLDDEALFNKVLWFLRPGNKNLLETGWITESNRHQREVFGLFMREFAQLGWQYSPRGRRWGEPSDGLIEKRLIASKPQLIDILNQLDELAWLISQKLDKVDLQKLTSLAMEEDFHFPASDVFESSAHYRHPVSLEEALLTPSVAAQVVILYGIREKERKRIDVSYEKSRQKMEEEERRRQLDNVEAEQRRLENLAEKLRLKA